MEVLEQRLVFAKDKAAAAIDEAKDTKAKFETFTQKIDSQAPREVLQNARDAVDHNISRLLSANTSTATVLGRISTGFDERGRLKWRPLTAYEAYLDDNGELVVLNDPRADLSPKSETNRN